MENRKYKLFSQRSSSSSSSSSSSLGLWYITFLWQLASVPGQENNTNPTCCVLFCFFAECLVQVFRFHLVAVVALPVLSSWAVHLRPPTAAPRCSDRLCGVCLHQEHDKHLFLRYVVHIGGSVTSFPVLERKFFLQYMMKYTKKN